jgi:Family of unknown function (DUF6152)
MKLGSVILASAVAVALAAPAFAHHSFAMFDAEKTVKVSGTVRQVEWTNPHVWLRVMVNNAQTGKPEQWGFEMGPPAQQIRRGWEPDSLKPGDTVTLNMHPLKDGSRGGQVVDATLPDGKTVGGAGAPAIR